jgi:hypothetical protein
MANAKGRIHADSDLSAGALLAELRVLGNAGMSATGLKYSQTNEGCQELFSMLAGDLNHTQWSFLNK